MDCSTKNSHQSIITLIFLNLVKHDGMDSFKVSRLENMWGRNHGSHGSPNVLECS